MNEELLPTVGLVTYIEVPGLQDAVSSSWKEITLNSGASQSTLQDIKFPETAGGYVYKESHTVGSALSNRHIHWRSHDSTLELVESSLDSHIKGGLLRLQFHHSAVLGGLSIHETPENVHVLLATVSSVYRLIFPHPNRIPHSTDFSFGAGSGWCPSVFRDATLSTLFNSQNSFVLNPTGTSVPLPHTAATGLNSQGDAIFVLALSTGTLQVVCMPNKSSGGKIVLWEIRHMSVMSRLWSGLVPSAIRGSQEGDDMAISLAICSLPGVTNINPCVVALCKDLRIRLWSLTKRECLLAAPLMDYCKNEHTWSLSGQQPCLEVLPYSDAGMLHVAVHLCFPELTQFLIFRIETDESGNIILTDLASIAAPEHALVDFKFTSTDMWTLWMDINSEPLVLYTPYNWKTGEIDCYQWKSLSFLPTSPQEVSFCLLDAREAFLKEIFAPGRFSPATIHKAISIYCRSSGETSFRGESVQKSSSSLKDRVTMAVENEIRSRACETELADEAYLELQHICWEQFLSYCIQYHEVGTKVLGLLTDPDTGFVGIIRKHCVSLCRPCDSLEVLLLSDVSHCSPNVFLEHAITIKDNTLIDPSNCNGLWVIMKSLQTLNEAMNENVQDLFDHSLFYLRLPEEVATEIADDLIFSMEGPLLDVLVQSLSETPQVLDGLYSLLLQMDLSKVQEDMDTSSRPPQDKGSNHSFFGSPSGVNAIYLSLLQMVKFRYYFCRDLSILELIIINLAKKRRVDMNKEQLQQLRSKIFSRTCCYTHSYFIMYWTLQTLATPVKQKTLETGLRELSLLDFPEPSQHYMEDRSETSLHTLATLFIEEHGTSLVQQILEKAYHSERPLSWSWMLLSYRALLAATMWPISMNMMFPEFLLISGQYTSLLEYVHLLKGWCERNSSSHSFLLANAYLSLSQPRKALALFCEAAKGIHTEPFLMERITGSTPSEATASYYLKVIQLFEYFNLPDCIIRLANEAIACCTDQPSLATLWSLIFKYHLDLDHCPDAYTAMMQNPESARRKDCLRQFLIVLYERGHQRELLDFSFDGFQDDVILILESKARSMDLSSQSYYEFLYAFHMKCENYQRASSCMYEYNTRLGQEMLGLNGLSRQAACLLTTINCLSLVDQNYAWIVKPVPTINYEEAPANMSPKRDYDGQEIEDPGKWRQLQVLEMSDILKEYELIHARMCLLRESDDHIAGPLSPSDTLTLLVSEELYPLAVKLCKSYSMSLQPIFEGLANRCATGYIRNYKHSVNTEQVWKMLQDYLSEHEAAGHSTYHRLISEKLLGAGLNLPTWLHRSYKSRNSPELLFVYLTNDFLIEAGDLAQEIIDNVLFQAKQTADPKKMSLWLPYTLLDNLLVSLEENSDFSYNQMYKAVTKKLEEYFRTVESWSLY